MNSLSHIQNRKVKLLLDSSFQTVDFQISEWREEVQAKKKEMERAQSKLDVWNEVSRLKFKGENL